MTKVCPKCCQEISLDGFARARRKSNGRQSWCRQCYREVDRRRHGVTVEVVEDLPGERWRRVVGFGGLYAVSDHGRVKRLAGEQAWNERLLKPVKATGGNRLVVNLWRAGKGHQRAVHRVVYEAWHGPIEPRWEIHHLTGDWRRNEAWNLLAVPKRFHKLLHSQAHEGIAQAIRRLEAEGRRVGRAEFRLAKGVLV